jgi:hypothetical protein
MADPAVVATLLLERCATLSVGSPVLPVAMPEMSFTPPKDDKGNPAPYLRIDLFNNAPFWEGLASGRIDQGLLQVTAVWPRLKGLIAPNRAVAEVRAHFPKSLRLHGSGVTVKINRAPWAASPITEPDKVSIPVTVSWVAS